MKREWKRFGSLVRWSNRVLPASGLIAHRQQEWGALSRSDRVNWAFVAGALEHLGFPAAGRVCNRGVGASSTDRTHPEVEACGL